jgi:hypothetical protein
MEKAKLPRREAEQGQHDQRHEYSEPITASCCGQIKERQ